MSHLNFDQITDRYSKKAKQQGVDLEVLMVKGSSFSASYNEGKLDPFSSKQTQSVGFRVIKDNCESVSYSESTESEDLDLAFNEAVTSVDLFPQSYTPELISNESYQDMPFLYNEALDAVPVADKLEKAKIIEETARNVSNKVSSVPYQRFMNFNEEISVFNTNGVNASYKSNGAYALAYVLVKQDEENQMSYDYTFSQRFDEIDTVKISERAANKAINKLGAETPETGNYPIVFTAEMAKDIISVFEDAFCADQVDKNLSILKGKLDEKVASDLVEIWDDPFLEKAPGSRPFDDEGAPSKRTCVVKGGVLKNFLTNSVYAKKMKMDHTASASRTPRTSLGIGFSNVYLKPADKLTKPLTSMYDKTIVIDHLSGLHSGYDSISGDFSIQAEGFLYEDGQRTKSLNNFVISGNIIDMLKGIKAVGDDLRYGSSHIICPSFLVESLSVAGK